MEGEKWWVDAPGSQNRHLWHGATQRNWETSTVTVTLSWNRRCLISQCRNSEASAEECEVAGFQLLCEVDFFFFPPSPESRTVWWLSESALIFHFRAVTIIGILNLQNSEHSYTVDIQTFHTHHRSGKGYGTQMLRSKNWNVLKICKYAYDIYMLSLIRNSC